MRTIRLIAILLPALVLAYPAQAARWVGISSKELAAPARTEVDTSSITPPSDGKLRIWHREIHPKPKIQDSGAFSFTRLTMLTEFQCDKRLAALIQRSYAAADGSELKNETFDTREPRLIAPDTSLEAVFNYACKRGVKPPAAPAKVPVVAAAVEPAPAVETKEAPKKKTKKGQEEPAPHPVHWTYTGPGGAEKWGSLEKAFETCSLGQKAVADRHSPHRSRRPAANRVRLQAGSAVDRR